MSCPTSLSRARLKAGLTSRSRALSAGVNLASVTLETVANDMANNTRAASQQLAQVPDAAAGVVLERIREQLGATDVILWNEAGVAVASVGTSMFDLNPERPSNQQLRSLRTGLRPLASIEGLDEVGLGVQVKKASMPM